MPAGSRILIVDDEAGACSLLAPGLRGRGFDVVLAAGIADAELALVTFTPDAVLLRVRAAGDGAELLRILRARGCDAAVLAVIPPDRIDSAVEAMRAGAESYLLLPLELDHAALVIERALERRSLRLDLTTLRDEVRERQAMVGDAPELQHIREVVRRAAPTKATVLVAGEPGTGRELVAQAIHEASPRRERPFVRVSCAARSDALLESELFGHEVGVMPFAAGRRDGALQAADGGTLFLHEVTHLAPALQVKLLRVLQRGEFERMGGREQLRADVRIIACSSRDLAEEVRAGRFRDDLYYRLNVVALTVPPLRQRKGDIPALVDHFLAAARRKCLKEVRAISPGALSSLFAYEWPGNVRELQATIDRAVALCAGSEITADHLSPVLHGARPDERAGSALIPGATLFEIEREAILRTLEEAGGSTTRAAQVLGISVRKIQYRLKEYRSGQLARRGRESNVLPFPRIANG